MFFLSLAFFLAHVDGCLDTLYEGMFLLLGFGADHQESAESGEHYAFVLVLIIREC